MTTIESKIQTRDGKAGDKEVIIIGYHNTNIGAKITIMMVRGKEKERKGKGKEKRKEKKRKEKDIAEDKRSGYFSESLLR